MLLGSAAAPGDPPYLGFTDASSPEARSQGGRLTDHLPRVAHGTPCLASWWSARAGELPGPLPGLGGPVCSAPTRPTWQARDEAWSLESKGCGLRSDCAPAQTPVPSWRTVCLVGVGLIPAGHVLGLNKVFHQRVPRLSSHCACLPATSRPPHHTSALTAGGEEALARDQVLK